MKQVKYPLIMDVPSSDVSCILGKTWRQNHGTEIEEQTRFERISTTRYGVGYTCSVVSEARSGNAMPPRTSDPVSAINLSLLFHSIQRAGQRNALSHTINLEGKQHKQWHTALCPN